MEKIIVRLLKEDKKKLIEILRNLNTKQEYVRIA